MKPEMAILKQITMRGRMAFALACLERLASNLNYTSPKYLELLGLLWEFTETENFTKRNQKLTIPQWEHIRAFGFWLIDDEKRPKPSYNSEPFSDLPEAVAGMLGLCAAIGEAHLYGAFLSEDSECLLEKIFDVMDEQRVQPPALDRFQKNKLNFLSDPGGAGFSTPRSFYVD
jgi:hypothetical protein